MLILIVYVIWPSGTGVKDRIKSNAFLYKPWLFSSSFENTSPSWIRNYVEVLENAFFGKVMGGIIIWDLSNQHMSTWLYGQKYKNMMLSNGYVHVIIYVGFYVNTWYWKYTRTQAGCQAPRLSRRRRNMSKSEGDPFWLWFWKHFSKSE